MAPPRATSHRAAVRRRKSVTFFQSLLDKYLNIRFFKYLLLEPAAVPLVGIFILLAESVINLIVIRHVPYTEIDWVAYMQECEGFLNGTTNYALLRGEFRGPYFEFIFSSQQATGDPFWHPDPVSPNICINFALFIYWPLFLQFKTNSLSSQFFKIFFFCKRF